MPTGGGEAFVAVFNLYGTYTNLNNIWTQLTPVPANSIATGDFNNDGSDDIAAAFTGYGTYTYINGVWTQITPVEADLIAKGDFNGDGKDDIVAAFSGYGTYTYVNDIWTQLTPVPADRIATGDFDCDGDDEIVASFSGYGTYIYDNGVWTQLTPVKADLIVVGDFDGDGCDEIVASFSGYGTYMYESGVWTQITPVEANHIATGDFNGDGIGDIVAAFSGYGTYTYISGLWTQITPVKADLIATGDFNGDAKDEIVAAFTGYGIYQYMNNSWTFITPVMPTVLFCGKATTTTLTVTYNGTGSTGGSVPVDSTHYQQGQTVTVLCNTGNLVDTGYSFEGWNTQPNGSGTTYTQGQTFTMGSANVTLYAMWTPAIIPTLSGGTNTSGESGYNLYVLEIYGTVSTTGGYILSDVTNHLLDYTGIGTAATVPFSTSPGCGLMFYSWLSADSAGDLWAVQNTASTASGWGFYSTAIVEFPNASGNPSSLTPTTIVTLPSNIIVNHRVAIDSSGNLWVDEINTGNGGESANIVEYTAASSYSSTGTIIPYSPFESHSGCLGAGLAFGFDGHLIALENYNNGTGGCNNQVMEYTPTGTPVNPPPYYPTGYPGQAGELAIDSSSNLWVFSSPGPTNCHYPNCTIPGHIYEVDNAGTPLQTLPLPDGVSGISGPAFDANGNLWFSGTTNIGEGEAACSSTYTSYVSEIPSIPPGTTTPITTASFTGSCTASPTTIFLGVAITPVPSTLPQ